MIYLDTSAFVKLYLNEDGSADVDALVTAQNDPLPIWHLTELEFYNALRFKVFLAEMTWEQTEHLISMYRERKARGQYHTPYLDPVALQEVSLQLTRQTPSIGCRSLDVLHVAAARLIDAALFVTADTRQKALADAEGLSSTLV